MEANTFFFSFGYMADTCVHLLALCVGVRGRWREAVARSTIPVGIFFVVGFSAEARWILLVLQQAAGRSEPARYEWREM